MRERSQFRPDRGGFGRSSIQPRRAPRTEVPTRVRAPTRRALDGDCHERAHFPSGSRPDASCRRLAISIRQLDKPSSIERCAEAVDCPRREQQPRHRVVPACRAEKLECMRQPENGFYRRNRREGRFLGAMIQQGCRAPCRATASLNPCNPPLTSARVSALLIMATTCASLSTGQLSVPKSCFPRAFAPRFCLSPNSPHNLACIQVEIFLLEGPIAEKT